MLLRFLTLLLLFTLPQYAADRSEVLESRETFTVKSISQAEYKVYKKVYITDESGKDQARIRIGTGEYVELKSVSAKIFDRKGKKKGRYKKKDFYELKSSGYGIIGSDAKSYTLDLSSVTSLPFTLELEFTQVYHSLFFWPAWYPQESIPVKEASYTVVTPPDIQYHHYSLREIEGVSDGKKSTTWTQSNLEPWPDEIAMPREVYDGHALFFTSDKYKLDDYSGSSDSWKSIADFYHELSKTQYHLDPALISDLDLQSAATQRDTIQVIYDYVQRSTRYVGMELGIHGWKPHSSQWVCENKYGDCKDLATFFISILRMNNIEAYPVLILTRTAGMIYQEFPDDRFNHLIACVPLDDDTLWVDCTMDDGRIDIIPSSDQGCNVVVVGIDGPVMLQTPIQRPESNATDFTGEVSINRNGSASLKGQLIFRGQASMQVRSVFQGAILADQREGILSLFGESAPGLELDTFSVSNLDDKYAPLAIHLEGTIPRFAAKTGNRLFVYPGLPLKEKWYGEHPSRRKQSFFAGVPSLNTSDVTFLISDGLELESRPMDVDLETEFGTIHQTVKIEGQNIRYNWHATDAKMRIEIEDYPAYYNFRLKAKQAHAAPLVFKQR